MFHIRYTISFPLYFPDVPSDVWGESPFPGLLSKNFSRLCVFIYVLNHIITSCLFYISTDVKEVFDLFDFWDGRDGMVDAAKIGDFLRCCNLNPTNAIVLANGGVEKMGSCDFFATSAFCDISPICGIINPLQRVNCLLTANPYFFYYYYYFPIFDCDTNKSLTPTRALKPSFFNYFFPISLGFDNVLPEPILLFIKEMHVY